MDLGTIKKCMDRSKYETQEQWADDIRQVWANAMKFNAPGARFLTSYFALQIWGLRRMLFLPVLRCLRDVECACFTGNDVHESAKNLSMQFEASLHVNCLKGCGDGPAFHALLPQWHC